MFINIFRQIVVFFPAVIFLNISHLGEILFMNIQEMLGARLELNLISLAFIYLFLLTIYLFLYEIILGLLDTSIILILSRIGPWLVKRECIRQAMFVVRLEYRWSRLRGFLNLGKIIRVSVEENDVWKGLNKGNVLRSIANILKFLTGFPVVLSVLLSSFSLHLFKVDEPSLKKIPNVVSQLLEAKIDFLDIFPRLPLMVALVSLAPTVFFFYFYGHKRDVRKVIEAEESEYLEEVVTLYRELMLWLEKSLYDISINYGHAIRNQKLIIESGLKGEISNYSELESACHHTVLKARDYNFMNLSGLEDFVADINRLMDEKVESVAREMALKNYSIWSLYWRLYSLKDLDRANNLFYTQDGVVSYVSNNLGILRESTDRMLEEDRKERFLLFAMSMYRNLKMLYALKRGSEALRKYLYSTRTERILVQIFLPKK